MKISTSLRNSILAAVADMVDAGAGPAIIEVRTGAAPANTSDADTGTLLATCVLSDPSFLIPSGGTVNARPILPDSSIDASGVAGHFRVKDSSGLVVMQGSCGATGSGADMTLTNVNLVAGGVFSITSLSITMPAGT